METALFRVWDRVSARIATRGPEHVGLDERVFAAIWLLEAEVNNGRFAQYMSNSAGSDAAVARGALATVGAGGALAVFDEFLALLPGGQAASTGETRQQQLDELAARYGEERFDEMLSVLDKRFYTTEDELRERLFEFVTSKGMLGPQPLR